MVGRFALRLTAASIISLESAEQRAEALDKIDDSAERGIVRFYIEDYFARRDGTPLPDLKR